MPGHLHFKFPKLPPEKSLRNRFPGAGGGRALVRGKVMGGPRLPGSAGRVSRTLGHRVAAGGGGRGDPRLRLRRPLPPRRGRRRPRTWRGRWAPAAVRRGARGKRAGGPPPGPVRDPGSRGPGSQRGCAGARPEAGGERRAGGLGACGAARLAGRQGARGACVLGDGRPRGSRAGSCRGGRGGGGWVRTQAWVSAAAREGSPA